MTDTEPTQGWETAQSEKTTQVVMAESQCSVEEDGGPTSPPFRKGGLSRDRQRLVYELTSGSKYVQLTYWLSHGLNNFFYAIRSSKDCQISLKATMKHVSGVFHTYWQ